MRHIEKQISIEPLVSRLPSVLPAYGNGGLYFFDERSIVGRDGKYPTNYGMIPLNIVLNINPNTIVPSESAYTAFNMVRGCHCYGATNTYDKLCNFVLSFYNLSKWFNFFREYYNLLKRYGHCGRVYTSAQDYYNYESGSKFVNQMKYGSNIDTYIELDNEFASKGGVVWVQTFNKKTSEYKWVSPKVAHDENSGDTTAIVDVEDRGLYKWICDNIVPSFKIPKRYTDYWNARVLYYPDVLKWIPWFESRKHYEEDAEFTLGTNGEVDTWNCMNTAVTENWSCCECEEYFNRGGKRMLDLLKNWNANIQNNIKRINETVYQADSDTPLNCFIPTVIMPMELQSSIDDLGEESIFSKDYELGIDYRVADHYASANTKTGTVVTVSGDSMILTSGCGFKYINEFMEKEYDKDGFSSYTDVYINANPKEFTVDFKYYTFDENNKRYTSSASSVTAAKNEFKDKIKKHYAIESNDNGWVLYDNVLYEIKKNEYGVYDSSNKYIGGNTYYIYREDGTETPYVIINDRKIYGELYTPTMEYYFPFFLKPDAQKVVNCSGKTFNISNYMTYPLHNTSTELKTYVDYNGSFYEVQNGATSVTINGLNWPIVTGYSQINEIVRAYCWDGKVCENKYNNVLVKIEGSAIENGEVTISYLSDDDIVVYPVDKITGRTVSKIFGLQRKNVLVDDIGNRIDGIYDLEAFRNSTVNPVINHQPQEGREIELLYQVGNTCNIRRFSKTVEKAEEAENGINYFVGDIITSMKFYYKTLDGEMESSTLVPVTLASNSCQMYTSLAAIQRATNTKENLEQSSTYYKSFLPDVYCDITYNLGATLSRVSGGCYMLADGDYNHGVEYKETVRFVKEKRQYYLKMPKNIVLDKNEVETPTDPSLTASFRRAEKVIPAYKDKPTAHSICYLIYVYNLTQDLETITESQYKPYKVPMATFEAEIDTFGYDKDGSFNSGIGNENYAANFSGDMATHNNMQVFPTFREEYKLGIASLENVDSDIYIDRGINASYEKHLKLGEVTSLEALEQYGNGYFKIIES
jgi:hypothetical protein